MTPPDLPTYFTTAEVALVLRETRENVSRRCKRGEIAAVRVGRKYLIRQAALDAFLTPASEPSETPDQPVFLTADHKKLALAAQRAGEPVYRQPRLMSLAGEAEHP